MRIFISYARSDLAFVARVVSELEAAGHDVWIDVDAITTPGGNWRRLVVQGIRASDAVVALLTPRSAASPHVERELAVADELRIEIVPVILERCAISDGLLYTLAALQHLDVSQQRAGEALASIVAHVDRRDAELTSALAG
jgi:TIR domain